MEKIIYRGNYKTVKETILAEYVANDTEVCGFFSAYTPDLTIEEQVRLYAALRLECDGDECYRVMDYPYVENLATGEEETFAPPVADRGPRSFLVNTPAGTLKVWSKHDDVDYPSDYPGVYVDLVSPESQENTLLACVEYDSCAKGVYAHIYADLLADEPTDSVCFEAIAPNLGLEA